MTAAPAHEGTTLTCATGGMALSVGLRDRLVEVFETRSRRAEGRPMDWGGGWFCPGCGCPATTTSDHVECPQCGELLDEFLVDLVELHPHRTRLLLVVEDTFEVRGRGLVLAPFLPHAEARPDAFPVELHRPDGSIRWSSAFVQVPFLVPRPVQPQAHLSLLDTPKGEVPLGTKVWGR